MREKIIRQHSIKDCGPCCLASIISYYKGYMSADTLAYMMHTSRDGTTAYEMIRVANNIGFKAVGMKLDKIDDVRLPCICHVLISNSYYHYMVIYKINNDRLLIGDPAKGMKWYKMDEFYNIWTNFIIELTPLKVLPKICHQSLFKYLLSIFKKYKSRVITIILLSYISMLLSYLYMFLFKYIIDNISNLDDLLVYVFILMVFTKILVLFITQFISINLIKIINIKLVNNIIKTLILLPYPYYSNYQTGEVISRYNDVESIKFIISDTINIIIDFPLVIVMFILLFMINIKIGFYILIILIIYLLLYYLFNRRLLKYLLEYREEKASYNSTLYESIKNYESIKAIDITDNIINKLINSNKKLEQKLYFIKKINLYKNLVFFAFNALIPLFLTVIYEYLNSSLIIIVYYIFNYILEPLTNTADYIINYKESINIYRRIDDFKIKCHYGTKMPINYDICFKNFNYSYGLKDILRDVNITIRKGRKVFIFGDSGCGKSTLVKLIKGFYKTSNLYIDDIKINKCSKSKIVYVGQNEHLFTGNLDDNLFKSKDIDFTKICMVNKDKNLFLEEDGFNLSGGEKSRVILARAISRDFEVLILDEALDNVDINTERIILKNLLKVFEDKTIIYISHRLDNIDLFNSLLEIKDGFVNYIES